MNLEWTRGVVHREHQIGTFLHLTWVPNNVSTQATTTTSPSLARQATVGSSCAMAEPEQTEPSRRTRVVRHERVGPVEIGQCIVCPAFLSAARKRLPDAMRLILGLSEMYCCSDACIATIYGRNRLSGKGARVVARYDTWVTSVIGTELREGDIVAIEHDFSPGKNIPKAMQQFAGLSLMYCCSEVCVAALRGTRQLDGASNYICSSTIAGEVKDQVDRDNGFDQLKIKLAVDVGHDLAHCDHRRRVAI